MIQLDEYIEATHSKMQLAISKWEDLIGITGGCLTPDKIVWYLVDYELIRGKWKWTNRVQDKILKATNKTRENFPLYYLKANEAIFMLWMYLASDGNDKD